MTKKKDPKLLKKKGRKKGYKKLSNIEEFKNLVVKYFEDCREKNKIMSITGLCLFINISRDTLNEYEKDPIYTDTIKRAKQTVENFVEENAAAGKYNSTFAIFNLKNNFGWKDSQEIKHSGLKPLEITVDSEDKKKKIDENL